MSMDIVSHNREAWARQVAIGNKWTIPVDGAAIEAARRGEWSLFLIPVKSVPRDWYGELEGARVLCLASGGGQQGPILAAAGARVTVFDNCPAQLEKDELVGRREGLEIELAQGDMKDLSRFADASFDLIFHPVSNCFVEAVEPVWRECARVLRRGGRLLAGFCNPVTYIFDLKAWDDRKEFKVRYSIPYSDVAQLPEDELDARVRAKEPLEYGHSLDSQIGAQIAAGFSLRGFFEGPSGYGDLLDPHMNSFIATLGIRD